jgi:hypothetical protein
MHTSRTDYCFYTQTTVTQQYNYVLGVSTLPVLFRVSLLQIVLLIYTNKPIFHKQKKGFFKHKIRFHKTDTTPRRMYSTFTIDILLSVVVLSFPIRPMSASPWRYRTLCIATVCICTEYL